MKCGFDGHCEINVKNRHVCSYCRLMKCFESGMQTEMIRASQSRSNRTNEKRKQMIHSTKTRSNKLEQVKIIIRTTMKER